MLAGSALVIALVDKTRLAGHSVPSMQAPPISPGLASRLGLAPSYTGAPASSSCPGLPHALFPLAARLYREVLLAFLSVKKSLENLRHDLSRLARGCGRALHRDLRLRPCDGPLRDQGPGQRGRDEQRPLCQPGGRATRLRHRRGPAACHCALEPIPQLVCGQFLSLSAAQDGRTRLYNKCGCRGHLADHVGANGARFWDPLFIFCHVAPVEWHLRSNANKQMTTHDLCCCLTPLWWVAPWTL